MTTLAVYIIHVGRVSPPVTVLDIETGTVDLSDLLCLVRTEDTMVVARASRDVAFNKVAKAYLVSAVDTVTEDSCLFVKYFNRDVLSISRAAGGVYTPLIQIPGTNGPVWNDLYLDIPGSPDPMFISIEASHKGPDADIITAAFKHVELIRTTCQEMGSYLVLGA